MKNKIFLAFYNRKVMWVVALGLYMLFAIGIAHGQGPAQGNNAQIPDVGINTVQDLLNTMCTVFGWMFWALLALSTIMIVVAAFSYVTAGDNAEKVSKATKTLIYAAIGVGVALLARAIPVIVGDFFGAGGIDSCA